MNQDFHELLGVISRVEEENGSYAILRVFREKELTGICVVRKDEFNEKLEEISLYYDSEVEVLSEVLEPRGQLLIMGAGHVGRSLGILGSIVGFDVVIVDDRPEFLCEATLDNSGITAIEEKFDDLGKLNIINGWTAVAIVTRGHQFDEVCLRHILTNKRKPKYIGMIGSKRRVEMIKRRLEGDGFSKEDLAKLHAPIGLRIGAVTPQEIAVAILAEIITKFRRE